jgi:Flp pilus assembly protein CpaB
MKQMSGSRLFMIAVVCGVVAAFLTVYYLKSVEEKYRRANQPERIEKVAVVVPKRDLNKGDTITIDAIGKLTVPKKFLPTHFIPATDYKKILNRTIASPMRAGRIMTVEAITGTKAETFSETVDLGRRAFSLKVNKVDSFDGLLRPGDTIDLLGEFDLEDLGIKSGSNQEVSQVVMPVLEEVKVLSAGREDHTGRRYEHTRRGNSVDGFNMEFTIITLSLTPKQVARVQLAEQAGDMFAVLRHPKDTTMADFDYIRADVLLEPEAPETVDVVLDENGNPVGRVLGDNVVDANGNIIGKVVDGRAVGFDGKTLGTIVEDVAEDDPALRVRERADVVRDAQGNVVGKVVDGKVVDREGNVIGRVDDSGRAVGLDGEVLGEVEKNVALDAQGNVVDLSDSAVPQGGSEVAQIVRDKNGKVIGRVKNGKIIDKNGRVIGRVNASGQAVGLNGEALGSVEQAMVDREGNVVGNVKQMVRDSSGRVIGDVQEVVRDKDGNVIGRVVDGKVLDDSGNVIGTVNADGSVTGTNGERLGSVERAVVDADGNVIGTVDENGKAVGLDGTALGRSEQVVVDEQGNVMGSVEKVARDASGNIIGRVVDGKVIDADGNVVGHVSADGTVIGQNGQVLGQVDTAVIGPDGQELEEQVQVARDAEGNIIGRVVDGQVIDDSGKVIGRVDGDRIVDASGNVIASGVSVSTEGRAETAAEARRAQEARVTREVDYIEFIPGGNDEEGIIPIRRIRLQ